VNIRPPTEPSVDLSQGEWELYYQATYLYSKCIDALLHARKDSDRSSPMQLTPGTRAGDLPDQGLEREPERETARGKHNKPAVNHAAR
jgi:hypothetical protein